MSADEVQRSDSNVHGDEPHCLICLGTSTNPTHFSCSCKFECCRQCLVNWILASNNTKCPLCQRTDVKILTYENDDICEAELTTAKRLISVWQAMSPNDDSYKTILKQASRHYLNAIAADRFNPGGYLGTAYLYLLVGDGKSAFRHVQFVINNIDENNDDARRLVEYIRKSFGPEVFEEEKPVDEQLNEEGVGPDHDAEIHPDGGLGDQEDVLLP